MDSNLTHWQNFIYGIFTSDLHLDTYVEEVTGVNAGFIIPGESAHIAMVGASVGLSQTWACEAVGEEFEKEITSALDSISDFRERQAFLLRMRYRFENIFERLPTYQEILPKLFTYVVENHKNGGLDLYERLYQFTNLIASVQYIIQEKYKAEMEVNNIVSKGHPATGANIEMNVDEIHDARSAREIKPSLPIIALFLSYLMNSKIEVFDLSLKNVEGLKKKYQLSHSAKSIRNKLYKVRIYNNKKDFISRSIELLLKDERFKPALEIAKNDLYELQINNS